jgi:spore coat protein H
MGVQLKSTPIVLIMMVLSMLSTACSGTALAEAQDTAGQSENAQTVVGEDQVTSEEEGIIRPEGWSEATHGDSAEPNYEVVFPQDEVNEINITITPDNWQVMLDDMTDLYGEQGIGGGFGGGMGGPRPEGQILPDGSDRDQRPEGQTPPEGFIGDPAPAGQGPQGGPAQPGGGMMENSENPVWVPVTIEFEGDIWTNVGLRFKGNSSLMSSWRSGSLKLPLKLDFDEFEDDYPEIDDQRFYGFKQLTLSSNFSDTSLLREKVTADIFREAGVPAPNTAFYAVKIDYGEGPIYLGLYTMVEVVDDTVIKTQFEDDSGNVYKPKGTGATFAEGSFNEASFDKETNAQEADYGDIQALFDALHSDSRTTDPPAWRHDLEAVFDVDTFIRWLAVNTVVQNWDTYGTTSHNYYLYNDPTSGKLTWIPWDNNMALGDGFARGRMTSMDLESVGDNWPLIRYLMDDPVYHSLYVDYVEETIHGPFEPTKMAQTYQRLHDLIQPFVTGEAGEEDGAQLSSTNAFDSSVDELIAHAESRYSAAESYINSQR